MDIRFDDKKAIVTGAGSGIGRGVALKLAECGAKVIGVSLIQEELDELFKTNAKIETICLDLGNWEATKNAISKVGLVDLLVNCAGTGKRTALGEITESEFDRVFNVNVKAIVNVSQVVANAMKSRGQGGSIVNISSILSMRALSQFSIYQSSKGSIDQLTRSMAVELGPHQIRVNSVSPSFIPTKLTEKFFTEPNHPLNKTVLENTPLKRFGEVENVVDATLFLLSEKASMITGVSLPIDGGIIVSL